MELNVPSKLAGGRFEVAEQLGAGCFGAVYVGKDKRTGRSVAIKFEFPENAAACALANEDRMMRALQNPELQQGFAEVFWYGKSRGNASLVMELLGRSLEDSMEACKGQMKPSSVVLVAAQAIMRIEYLHSRGIVHRDIKPENFMWGINDKIHHLYLIDFGMCTTYYDKSHLPVRSEASLVGTARYASINTHQLKTQSRRDDLEAIGHVFFYLLRGKLPWSGLKAKTDEEKYRKIGEVKQTTPVADLCKGHPQEFARYLEYSRALKWEERPDYERLHQLIRSVREQLGPLDPHELEWLPEDLDVGAFTAIRTWNEVVIKQPDDVNTDNFSGNRSGMSRCGTSDECMGHVAKTLSSSKTGTFSTSSCRSVSAGMRPQQLLGSEGVCPVMKRRAAPLPLAEPGMAGGLLVVLALGHAAVAAGTRLARNASTAAALRGHPGGPVADLPRGAGRRTAAANDTLGGLRPPAVHLAARLGQERKAGAPCACEPHSSSWVRCQRTVPKCVWIDLGAADGNTLKAFLNNQYGPVGNCPSAAWEAMLVEANPRFNAPLQEMASRWPGMVHLFESTAAYMCPAQTSFYQVRGRGPRYGHE
ncbi:unnamed protein product [Prorocentrum cordatum]|uniref:Casein kinase I n=1 Tax=Prorocentrum cordatum TaxID=2364126 RepID=A0ABN9WIT0_9DINO|nr:unnamed protein product [Polarella glacialis]